MLPELRAWAKSIKRDAVTLWLAARDPRTPWYVKVLAGAVAAYALSPIDLIPDVIPVLGYLDDLIVVPLGIWAVVALMPVDLMAELRAQGESLALRPVSRTAAAAIVFIWFVAVSFMLFLGWRHFVAQPR